MARQRRTTRPADGADDAIDRQPPKAAGKGRPTGQSSPRRGREQATERILAAAAELFAQRGPANVTVRDIAATAGVSHALVHRYLGTKDQILLAVLIRGGQRIMASADELPELRDAVLAMLRESRHGQPQHIRTVTNAAIAGLPLTRLGFDFPSVVKLRELAEREHDRVGGRTPKCPEISPNVLIAAVVALAAGWATLEDYLLPAVGLDRLDKRDVEAELERVILCLIDGVLPPATDDEGTRG
jgi:TetR/AcrR family transcriptional regulator, repressor for neighboring sulfatase